jgi:hypothetical protein
MSSSPGSLLSTNPGRGQSHSVKWLFAAIAVATVCKICLALFTYGTNDASMWESSAELIRQGGARSVYDHLVEVHGPDGKFLHYQIFNHPPFMILVLAGLNQIRDATEIPIRSSLRLLNAAADVASVILTAAILRSMFGVLPLWPIILVAIAPSWVFISGFHANSDPLMLFFLVLATYLIEVRRQNTWGVLSFAFASGIKVVPVLLLPALLLYFKTWSERLRVILIMAVFWSATANSWLIGSPAKMIRTTLGYGSMQGHWGLGVIFRKLPIIGSLPAVLFNATGRYILILAIVAVAWRLNRGRRPVALFYQFGVLLFLFHLVTPGFGIQYLAWLSPWVAALPWSVAAAYFAASGAFCAGVYTYWSRGVPWYFANSVITGTWRGGVNVLGLITWLTVALVLAAYWRHLRLQPLFTIERGKLRSSNSAATGSSLTVSSGNPRG